MSVNFLKRDFFTLLRTSLNSIDPSELITSIVKIEKDAQLSIPNKFLFKNQDIIHEENKKYCKLDGNVYVAAFGKAALGFIIQR